MHNYTPNATYHAQIRLVDDGDDADEVSFQASPRDLAESLAYTQDALESTPGNAATVHAYRGAKPFGVTTDSTTATSVNGLLGPKSRAVCITGASNPLADRFTLVFPVTSDDTGAYVKGIVNATAKTCIVQTAVGTPIYIPPYESAEVLVDLAAIFVLSRGSVSDGGELQGEAVISTSANTYALNYAERYARVLRIATATGTAPALTVTGVPAPATAAQAHERVVINDTDKRVMLTCDGTTFVEVDPRRAALVTLSQSAPAPRLTGVTRRMIDLMTAVNPQVDVNGDPTAAPPSGSIDGTAGGTAGTLAEAFSGAFSTYRSAYVDYDSQAASSAFVLRNGKGELISRGTAAGSIGTGTNRYSRGTYCKQASLATSRCYLFAAGLVYYATVIDGGAASAGTIYNPGSGNVAWRDTNPLVDGAAGKVYMPYLAADATTIGVAVFDCVAGTVANTGATGLTQTPEDLAAKGQCYSLHQLPSGRIWLIGSRRAVYTDNGGTSWTADSAVQGASAGELCVYDAANSRWVRFGWGTGNVYTAPLATPSVSTLARTSTFLVYDVCTFGRYTFAIGVHSPSGTVRVAISSDCGMNWFPVKGHFRNMTVTAGESGSRFQVSASDELKISASAGGVAARVRNAVAGVNGGAGTHQRVITITPDDVQALAL